MKEEKEKKDKLLSFIAIYVCFSVMDSSISFASLLMDDFFLQITIPFLLRRECAYSNIDYEQKYV